jgi:pyruvate formate lyase activating enzyme
MKASLGNYLTVREAFLYEKMPGDKVRCGLCERRCMIGVGERGFYGTRENVDGKLLARA